MLKWYAHHSLPPPAVERNLAARIDRRKSATEIKTGATLVITDLAVPPSAEGDIQPRRVFFTLAGSPYWTFEWIFSDACDEVLS
jgi:hypothetical protein